MAMHIDYEDEQEGQETPNLSEMGNGQRFITMHGENVRYCAETGKWYIWHEMHWKEDKTLYVERMAKDVVRAIYREAAQEENARERKKIAQHALQSESKNAILSMVRLAQSEDGIPVSVSDLDTNQWLLNCTNGTVDLKTGKLLPHRKTDLITRAVPVAYKPRAACLRWLTFLDRIFDHDAALISFVQRAIGYALTGDTSEQCFFLLHGDGNNGKSTLLETIRAILGDYSQSADFNTFLARKSDGIRNDLARMTNKRLVIAKESNEGRRLDEAVIKELTGEDTITARFLYSEHSDFVPTAKLFLAANTMPQIRGKDEGIWRRVCFIPFAVAITLEEKDKHLKQKLQQEAEGILAWAVQGCLDWQENGLQPPDSVHKATAAYRTEMNTVARFVAEMCEREPGTKTKAGLLYEKYKSWCEQISERPDNITNFGRSLAAMGIEKDAKPTKTGIYYRDITVIEDTFGERLDRAKLATSRR